MIKSPLRYPGGKSRSAEKIVSLIPQFDEYGEPFLGGGSIYLQLKQQFPNKQFWINDLYFELYKFWEMCQKDVQSVVNQVLDRQNPIMMSISAIYRRIYFCLQMLFLLRF